MSEQNAQISVTREKQFLSAWSRFKVLVDDQPRGYLAGGGTVTAEVSPGAHRVAVQYHEPSGSS